MTIQYPDIENFKKKAQVWASSFSIACIFNSNHFHDPYTSFSMMLAVGCRDSFVSDGNETFPKLESFLAKHSNSYVPGYLSYDLKNEIEGLTGKHINVPLFPDAFFFIPETIIKIRDSEVTIISDDPNATLTSILSNLEESHQIDFQGKMKARMTRGEYGMAFKKLKKHIHNGDIYEANLCQEFYADPAKLNPFAAYQKLNTISPTPFSCFFRNGDHFIISASPERFLAKRKTKLISQPIKGTAPRGKSPAEDERIKEKLRNNPKEISENIMIVDLVRNDLTRSAAAGSVEVKELLGLYSFQQVHQLISTISCTLAPHITTSEAIKNTFPPGSMTGAPKISAMKIIEENEVSRRGIYSGAVGYFGADGDFDFNVVIRTLIYNAEQKYLSYHVGGAVTALSREEEEYKECLLKAEAIQILLGS